MKIIEPSVGLWKQGDDVKAHVAKCARVCYGKETGNDDVTINTLLKKHHWSMFRHESVYVIGEFTSRLSIALTRYDNNPYIDWTFHNNKLYIVTNGNFILDLKEQQEVNAHAQVLLTYSINEWKHIIKLRSDSAAHPNAQIISNMIKKELESLGYEFN